MINTTIALTELSMQNPIWQRFIELIGAPYFHKEMIWIVTPLIMALVLMQLYFGRYRKEELGWNTAVGNSLALIFVSVDLFRYIYTTNPGLTFGNLFFGNMAQMMVAIIIVLVSIWLLFGEFFHLLPKKLAFLISSSLPTTLIAYLGIVFVYAEVSLDIVTLLAGIMLLIVLVIMFKIIHLLEPISIKEESSD